MNYVLIGGVAIVGLMILLQLTRRTSVRQMARYARWGVGGLLAALTGFLLLRGQIGIASITGPVAFMILRFGRIGRFSFEGTTPSDDNESTVRSRYISMKLDHDTGQVEGRVTSGVFRGRDLMDLGEDDTRALLDEVSTDPDSLALLETWLDRNRAGWREYFAGQSTGEPPRQESNGDPDAEAYEVLGLKPGATEAEIRDAHRKLMMGVHPDQGGSNYLAAKINAAKDRLLKKVRGL